MVNVLGGFSEICLTDIPIEAGEPTSMDIG